MMQPQQFRYLGWNAGLGISNHTPVPKTYVSFWELPVRLRCKIFKASWLILNFAEDQRVSIVLHTLLVEKSANALRWIVIHYARSSSTFTGSDLLLSDTSTEGLWNLLPINWENIWALIHKGKATSRCSSSSCNVLTGLYCLLIGLVCCIWIFLSCLLIELIGLHLKKQVRLEQQTHSPHLFNLCRLPDPAVFWGF